MMRFTRVIPQTDHPVLGEMIRDVSKKKKKKNIYIYSWIFQIFKNFCLLVGFLGDFRHKFYTQKEDPGITICMKKKSIPELGVIRVPGPLEGSPSS